MKENKTYPCRFCCSEKNDKYLIFCSEVCYIAWRLANYEIFCNHFKNNHIHVYINYELKCFRQSLTSFTEGCLE